jgi:hypothetical protein
MVPDEFKGELRSKGIVTARKKKRKELAVITECCTGWNLCCLRCT